MRRTTTSSLPQINRPILDEVAIVRTDDSDSISRFTLGHQYYRDDICTVKTMDLSYLRKVFEGYKNMTRCVDERDIYNLPMDVKKVTIRGHYKKYTTKLTPETELSEFDAGKYRGFFFIDRVKRVIQMIAVDKHPEDKKHKR